MTGEAHEAGIYQSTWNYLQQDTAPVSPVSHQGFSSFYQTEFVNGKHSYSYSSVPQLSGLRFVILLNGVSLIPTGMFLLYTVAGSVFPRQKAVNSEFKAKECKS